MIEYREELMVSPTIGGIPKLRKAHFLKTTLKPINQPLPKPPSVCLSSNPNINDIMKRVLFRGRVKPPTSWMTWVDDLQKTHQHVWKKVGIFGAIRASTYHIKKDNQLIFELAQRWCPETNTFIFPWVEATITLEDVMILGGFSVLGVSVLNPCQNREFVEIEAKLVNACSEIRRNFNLVTQHGWMNFFKGSGGELEYVAFLVLWLSRYVFPTHSHNVVAPNVYLIGICLARGIKIALAPAVLASIYRDLTLLKEKIVASISEGGDHGSKLSLCAPFQLVQLWAWERFPIISPKPEIQTPGEPRLARWHNIEKPKIGSLRVGLESGGVNFLWRPNASYLKNLKFPKFYGDGEMWMLLNSEVDEDVLSFARCLRPCELVGVDCVEQYSPHRVGLEFGMDQDIPDFFPRLNHDLELAWSSYNKPLNGLKLYLPPRLLNGDVTVRYSNWWRAAPLALHDDHVYESSRTNMKGNGFCTSLSNETVALGLAGGSYEMPMKNLSSSPANVVPTQDPLGDVINATGKISLVNLVMTSKGDKEDSKKEHLLEGKMPLLNPEMEKLCCVFTKETEGKAAEEMNMMQMNNSFDVEEDDEEEKDSKTSEALNFKLKVGIRDTIEDQADGMAAEDEDGMNQVSSPLDTVISDEEEEEEDGDLDPFGVLESELEARISRLEGLVSTLRAAKLCPP